MQHDLAFIEARGLKAPKGETVAEVMDSLEELSKKPR